MAVGISLSPDAMNRYIYGDNSSSMLEFVGEQMTNIGKFSSNVSNSLMESLQKSYDFLKDTFLTDKLEIDLANAGLVSRGNYFSSINTLEGLRDANPVMQRFIMAYEPLRQIYLDQNCDGYSDQYQNHDGKAIGSDSYDYRRAMDGVPVFNDEDDSYYVEYFFEDLEEGDQELTHTEKVALMDTRDYMKFVMQHCNIDFTKMCDEWDDMNI